jgi:hypothetical protein
VPSGGEPTEPAPSPQASPGPDPASRLARRRATAALVAVLVVATGLGVRGLAGGPVASAAGDVLYAVLVYLLVVVLLPRLRPLRVGAVALAVCWAVELAQTTGVPAALAEAWWPVRYVLGTSFVWTDLVLGAVGALLACGVDLALRDLRGRRSVSAGGQVASPGTGRPV